MPKQTILSSNELIRVIRREIPANLIKFKISTFDNNYAFLDDASALRFVQDLSFQVQQILGPWKEEYRDCDKFARFFQSLASVTHARSWIERGGVPNAGLAVGVFSYERRDGEGHMAVLLVTKVRGKDVLKVRIFDPETGTESTLLQSEKLSAFGLQI